MATTTRTTRRAAAVTEAAAPAVAKPATTARKPRTATKPAAAADKAKAAKPAARKPAPKPAAVVTPAAPARPVKVAATPAARVARKLASSAKYPVDAQGTLALTPAVAAQVATLDKLAASAAASAAKRPAAKPATPQVAPIAGMSPLGLPMAANMPARAYTVTMPDGAAFTVERAANQSVAGFMSTRVGPHVLKLMGWPRIVTDTCQGGSNVLTARFASPTGEHVEVTCVPGADSAKPAATATATPAFVTRGGKAIDTLAAAAGIAPAPLSPIAKAQAQRKALSEMAARNKLALAAAQPRRTARVQAIYDAAAKGVMPEAPDFSAETHARYRKPLAEVTAAIKRRDIAWLKAHPMQPLSSSRVALCRYRDCAVIAIEARNAKAAARAAGN